MVRGRQTRLQIGGDATALHTASLMMRVSFLLSERIVHARKGNRPRGDCFDVTLYFIRPEGAGQNRRKSRPAMCRPLRALSKVWQPPPRALPGADMFGPFGARSKTAQHQKALVRCVPTCWATIPVGIRLASPFPRIRLASPFLRNKPIVKARRGVRRRKGSAPATAAPGLYWPGSRAITNLASSPG
jgi:hypothetical protein